MGIIVDLIIILILGLSIYNGYKKGLVKSLLKLCTSILAIIIALILYKSFVNFVVENTTIDNNIQMSLQEIMTQNVNDDNEELINEDSGVPKPIVKYLNENVKESVDDKKEIAITETSKAASVLIVNIACILILYIIAKILLIILTVFVDVVAKLPVINKFNEVGGIIYGVLEGVIIILIILTLISVITPLVGNYQLSNIILESYVGKLLYNSNIFLNLIF
ncbi:MAG: CvpA family protein [Clostridia bacterium]|nr:CvpA family protein [Clostridia bacterium]